MATETELEEKLRSVIFPDLQSGRKNFDLDHTSAVVIKLKEILDHSPDITVDRTVLLITAYAHDLGYAEIYHGKEYGRYGDMIEHKAAHMEIGAGKLKILLSDPFFAFLTESQKERAVHLVATHDKLTDLRDTDELIFMEADTLGGLDTALITPTITPEENERYLRGVERLRLPKFITDYGKKEAPRLIKSRIEYYASRFSI